MTMNRTRVESFRKAAPEHRERRHGERRCSPLKTTSSAEWRPIPEDVLLIAAGGLRGGKVHMQNCDWAPDIVHSWYYLRIEDAIEDGFPVCRTCNPRRHQPELLARVSPDLIQKAIQRLTKQREGAALFHTAGTRTMIATVQFSDGEIRDFELVPDGMGDGQEKISVTSRLALAILATEEGERVLLPSPHGDPEEVLIIRRPTLN
jgi:hypothetical protein